MQNSKTPGLVKWLGYSAVVFMLLLPVAVLIVRSGAWQPGLLAYAAACFGSILLLMLFILLSMLPRFVDHRAALRNRILFTLPGTVALLSLTMGGGDSPRIHDITTDTADPPEFVTAGELRGPDANTLAIKPAVIEAQRQAYPDITSLQTPLDTSTAFNRALATARSLGWEVYHEDPSAGVIEAVETTSIMLFKDDIVIRVRPAAADGSVIDLRSVSRVGQGDLGANAERIARFVSAFESDV